jgi:YD repeat-containing protein
MTACHYREGAKKQTEFSPLTHQPANNGCDLQNYRETYGYDAAGNLTETRHESTGGWTRTQTYAGDSNRLIRSDGGCPGEDKDIPHDGNGNILELPHIKALAWDHANQLVHAELNGGLDHAYYQYDAAGMRVRKVVLHSDGRREERIYLGGYEVFRASSAAGAETARRTTLHVMDDQQRIALVEQDEASSRRTRYQRGGSATRSPTLTVVPPIWRERIGTR